MRKIKLCKGYIAAKRHAEKHARKEFANLDAENQKLDQMDLFKKIDLNQ